MISTLLPKGSNHAAGQFQPQPRFKRSHSGSSFQTRTQKISRESSLKKPPIEIDPPGSLEADSLVKAQNDLSLAIETATYRTRYQDGGHVIEVSTTPKFKIRLHRGPEPEDFETVGDFFYALRGKRLTWSLGRYLRFPVPDATPAIWELVTPSTAVGIDLVNRSHEVAKLLFAGFSRKIARAGLDIDDVLQEVYKALMVRNAGKCPWDPAKSTFGHYVYMVISCTLLNLIQRKSQLQVVSDDVSSRKVMAGTSQEEVEVVVKNFMKALPEGPYRELGGQMLPLLQEGQTIREMAAKLGVDRNRIAKALTYLKENARELLA